MAVYRCHLEPDRYVFECDVLQSVGQGILLSESWLHPGGGGQPPDVATIRGTFGSAKIISAEQRCGETWHITDAPVPAGERVQVSIDKKHRLLLSQLHTDTHILNALVFRQFNGALVTGAKICADGTAHMDFDLPDLDNDRLRALEEPINDVIRAGLPVKVSYVSIAEASRERGLIRNLSVAPPPTSDGRFRVVEIENLDRQACGGTHLESTSESPPIAILKIDNKGRRNRRVRIGLKT